MAQVKADEDAKPDLDGLVRKGLDLGRLVTLGARWLERASARFKR
jgi:hypothetical protein